MKVLHLPVNIASQISFTVRGLRLLGVDALGLARRSSVIQDCSGIETVDWTGKLNPVSRLARGIHWRLKLLQRVAWADLIHWHWGESTWKGLDLRAIALLRKPRLVEFWGDDLRDPNLASRDNRFAREMFKQHPERATDRGEQAQALFASHGFHCLIPGYELSDYLKAEHFSGYYHTRACLMLDDYLPHFPESGNRKPLLVHAPSHKGVKGTPAVLAAVDKLKASHRFDFKLLHDVPRAQALAIVAKCDVFLDQFVLGCEGLAAHEAMALGKPVVCFIKPSLVHRYPKSLPIIIADQNNLADVLLALLKDPSCRRDVGIRSRQYIEQYHDARKIAAESTEIYADVISAMRSAERGKAATRNRHWCRVEPRPVRAEGVV